MGAVKSLSSSCIFTFNVIDTLLGLGIIGLAVYCLIKKIVPPWVVYIMFVVGGVILAVAILSVIGLTCNSPLGLSFSMWMSLPLALVCLAFGIVVAAFKSKFEEYLSNNKAELQLTDEEFKEVENAIEHHAYVIAGVLGGVFLLQVLRFIFSKSMQSEYHKDDDKRRAKENEMEEAEGLLAKKNRDDATKEKYSDMKDKYREKYNKEKRGQC